MRIRRSEAQPGVNRVDVKHWPVDALRLLTVDESHPAWKQGAESAELAWVHGVAAARLYPPVDAPEALVRTLVGMLRARGVAAKVMPRERVAVDPVVAARVAEARPSETVRQAVDACVADMSARVKLTHCDWDEVRAMLDEQLGRIGL